MRLLILHHDRADLRRVETHYVFALCPHWEKQGVEVVHHAGCANLPPADVVLLHVDLSVVPDRFERALRAYPRVWNRTCVDIRKRRLPDRGLMISSPMEYAGPVIVKTDLNFGAGPERTLFRKLKWTWDPQELWQNFRATRAPEGRDYPIYPDATSVPAGVWRDSARVVEKFLPEREGERYVVRWAYFCGARQMAFRSVSAGPVVRWSAGDREEPVPIPAAVSAYRERIGLDYGKIDYVEHKGRPLILDVNKTVGGPGFSERHSRLTAQLAPGLLESFPAGVSQPA
jgi:hypothetical protein